MEPPSTVQGDEPRILARKAKWTGHGEAGMVKGLATTPNIVGAREAAVAETSVSDID